MKIQDKFKFGKYKGQTLKSVMAEHGSYVGWCLENIQNFSIEPKSMQDAFIEGYNRWKETHSGLTMHYSEKTITPTTSATAKKMMQMMINRLDKEHADELINIYDEDDLGQYLDDKIQILCNAD